MTDTGTWAFFRDGWAKALAMAPREAFLPDRVWPWEPGRAAIDRSADEPAWLAAAAVDAPVVTQWDNGASTGPEPGIHPTCSCSMPSLVARMLAALGVVPGDRVLDLGAGTGWTTGLLSAYGTAVTATEIDPRLAAEASARIRAAGLPGEVMAVDGADGWPAGAPYDALQAGYAVQRIPKTWLEQVRPGGVIVAPWQKRMGRAGGLLRLEVGEHGAAHGQVLAPVSFMPSRPDAEHWPVPQDYRVRGDDGGWITGTAESVTTRGLDDIQPDGGYDTVDLLLSAMCPTMAWSLDTSPAEWNQLWLYGLEAGRSWACVFFESDPSEPNEVYQWGPRRLWDEVEAALTWWEACGRPDMEDWRVEVTNGGDVVFSLP